MNRGQLARYLEDRAKERRSASFTAESLCFPEQLAPLEGVGRRKVLRCGRRAGKTTAVAFKLLLAAGQEPAVPVLYVTITRENAREIIWGELLRLNDAFALGGVASESRLILTMPSGTEIQLRGAHTEKEIAKYRGKKFKLVIIDEAQSFPDRIIKPLIQDVIGPTLLDHQGELWLVGTPPPLRRGYFFECYAGKLAAGREQYHWTVRHNTKLPARVLGADIDAILGDIRKEFGWTEDDPTYLREYEGLDIEDTEALLYQWREGRNSYSVLPSGPWTYLVAADIGYDDSDAVGVLGWPRHEQCVYLIEEHVHAEHDVTDLAEVIKPLIPKYKPITIVMDEHKKTTAELRRRHGIPITAAEKHNKPGFIKLFNADMRKGRFKARTTSTFAQDCGLVRKDPDALVRGVLQELPASKGGFHSDACDMGLYGWRAAQHYLESAPPPDQTYEQSYVAKLALQERARTAQDPLESFLGFSDD